MMKTKYVVLLIWLIVCFPYSASISAETRYVSDQLEVTFRRGPSLSHAVLRMLKSGTPVEVLENDPETGHTRVKISNGMEGWILSRYLSVEPDTRSQLIKMIKQIDLADANEGSVSDQLKAVRAEYERTRKRLQTLESENKQLVEQMESIKKTSANVLRIDGENKELHEKLITNEERLISLQLENRELENHNQKDWFIAGALVLCGGIVLGVVLPMFSRRKRSPYGSFD
ncbi:TIGR04211 family SH3 domain-containing protein [Nitrosomonas supralitoralis]|uniref:TIGR04211 family SH3 domain-containing protein n=1 Tax=Nitrosomonas supralitoralis TaxID=2116706 RepID=A0A2P7NZN8_9PROT|nr:TIGR04211 family SH3 domain-containing protein [Nitrosomonas supralitoralis]PSJ18949.1 TIGR04211 family SH3 domain-containing protein [Nitrosomonas supralitoralis]